jgi:hypothetical protein
MNQKNTTEEIKTCMLLEKFKLLPLEQRYGLVGYVKMNNWLLDIEDVFQENAMNAHSKSNIKMKNQMGKLYSIPLKDLVVPADTKYLKIMLTPMQLLNESKDVIKKSQKFLSVKNMTATHLNVESLDSKKIDDQIFYHIKFLSNFYNTLVTKMALDRIEIRNYEEYMLNFNMNVTQNFPKFNDDDFVWINENIASNEPQKRAVKQIVNRTSFPSPFIGTFYIFITLYCRVFQVNFFIGTRV